MNVLSAASKIRSSRKSERGSRDRGNLTTQDEGDPNKTPEPRACTGNFQLDFTELCRQNEIPFTPQIVPRGRPPVPVLQPDSYVKNVKSRRTPVELPSTPAVSEDDGTDPAPKTFIIKDKFEYFKPTIQVEMDNFDKPNTTTEVYIRGWRIDEPMMAILQQCWITMDKLHTINLWNVGLNDESYNCLVNAVYNMPNLRNLILDGNTLDTEPWHQLLVLESSLQNLSLRHCCISDTGAEKIGNLLADVKKFNSKLISLNLTGNRITDKGAEVIAMGLRMNRSLLTLNLSFNWICDAGAVALAKVLSYFPLTQEENVERRKLMSESFSSEGQLKSPESKETNRPPSVNRKSSDADKEKGKQVKSQSKRKDSKGKDDDKSKKKEKEDRARKDKNSSVTHRKITAGLMLTIAAIDKKKPKKSDEKKAPLLNLEPGSKDILNALTEAYYRDDIQKMVSGNKILISLNLSRNKIGEDGITALLNAVNYQNDSRNKSNGTGIMRLCLFKNKLTEEHKVLKEINEIMLKKDPFYKDSPKTPEE